MSSSKQAGEIGHRHGVVNTSFWTFVQMMVLHIGAFATTMYLTRMLSTNEYGLIPLLNALVLLFVAVVGLGVPNAVARYIAAQDGRVAQKVILIRAVQAVLPWTLISIAVLAIVFPIVSNWLDESSLRALRWVFICVLVLELFRIFVEKICHGAAAMKISASYSLWATAAVFVVTVPVVLVYPTALAALWAKVAALTLPSVRLLFALKNLFSTNEVASDKELPTGLEMVRYGIPLAAISLSSFGFVQADILMLGYFGDASMVGLYAVSVFLFTRLTVFGRAIGFGVAPLFAKDSVSQQERARFLIRGLKYAMLVAIPVTAYMIVNGEALVVFLFGKGYVGTGVTVALLSIYFLMASMLSVLSPILDFVGKAKVRAAATFLGAIVNVIVNMVLIPIWGIAGAAMATIIGYLTFSVIVFIAVSDLLRPAFYGDVSFRRLAVIVGPMVFIVLSAVRILIEDASALVNIGLLCTLYPFSLLALGVIGREEIIAMKKFLP